MLKGDLVFRGFRGVNRILAKLTRRDAYRVIAATAVLYEPKLPTVRRRGKGKKP